MLWSVYIKLIQILRCLLHTGWIKHDLHRNFWYEFTCHPYSWKYVQTRVSWNPASTRTRTACVYVNTPLNCVICQSSTDRLFHTQIVCDWVWLAAVGIQHEISADTVARFTLDPALDKHSADGATDVSHW